MPIVASVAGSKATWIDDAFAGMHCVTDVSLAITGSVRTNNTIIVTANGTTKPKYRCDINLPLRSDKGGIEHLHIRGVLFLDNVSYNLISLGCLAKVAHVALTMQATTGDATLTLANGRIVSMLNGGVCVVLTQNVCVASSPTVVTQGNQETLATTQMAAELLHVRFNHRRAEVIRLLPQCTRDAPNSWAAIARNIACDDCV
eukprot:6189197-Pleurochrysis_carterae.AAC.1